MAVALFKAGDNVFIKGGLRLAPGHVLWLHNDPCPEHHDHPTYKVRFALPNGDHCEAEFCETVLAKANGSDYGNRG